MNVKMEKLEKNVVKFEVTIGADKFAEVDAANVVGTWRVNIPYATYTGE